MNARIAAMRAAIAQAAADAGRDPASVTLLGVTKGQPRAAVLEAIGSGLGDIGESYLQEARPKYFGLPPVRKHFIGHVQTNKARAIVETFDVVQSIDRVEAARAIAKAARVLGKPLRVLLQVNVSPNERFGFAPEEAPAIAARLRKDEGLEIDGIMAIGPLARDGSVVADAFRRAALAFKDVGGSTFSVGMSGDWREAIACGSTMVRLGTALFGPRPAKEHRKPGDEPARR